MTWSKNRLPDTLRTACLLLALAVPASAQELTLEDLQAAVRGGERVEATDETGRKLTGRLGDIHADGVEIIGIQTRRVPLARVTSITRGETDAIWNGLAIGTASGLGGGLALWAASGGCDCYTAQDWFRVLGPFVAVGAAAGVAVDLAISDRLTIYRSRTTPVRASVAPTFAKGGAGLRLSVKF